MDRTHISIERRGRRRRLFGNKSFYFVSQLYDDEDEDYSRLLQLPKQKCQISKCQRIRVNRNDDDATASNEVKSNRSSVFDDDDDAGDCFERACDLFKSQPAANASINSTLKDPVLRASA